MTTLAAPAPRFKATHACKCGTPITPRIGVGRCDPCEARRTIRRAVVELEALGDPALLEEAAASLQLLLDAPDVFRTAAARAILERAALEAVRVVRDPVIDREERDDSFRARLADLPDDYAAL